MSVQTSVAVPDTGPSVPTSETAAVSPIGEVLRDIARGGFAGAISGVIFAGIGGRIVMRLAALLVPAAAGSATENGNRIGEITLPGSLALLFVGLIVGLLGGTIWVVISPWIPGTGLRRAVVTMPIAVALVATGLIEGTNPDFFVLRHEPAVVVLLVGLVAIVGLAISLIDDWLDRHLPHPGIGWRGVARIYAVVALVGALLIALPMVLAFAGSSDPTAVLRGATLLAVAVCTIRWWVLRINGRSSPPGALVLVARGALLVAIGVGFVTVVPEISGALGNR